MTPLETPKIFVSYSWSNPEHEELVLDLSKSLVADGIEILLDKWELREGNDPIAFMESMVNDPSITKIIMIIDNKYTERANSRQGGVGTESTILSNELYSKRDKNKIVAVIAEPNAKPPTFYAGRLYIDLSDQDKYAEEYEKLVRWAFDQYKYEKPKTIGKPPSFITSDDSTIVLHTNTEFRIALDAVEKGKTNASGNVKSYLNKLNLELPKLSINSVERDQVIDSFEKGLKNFQPHLLEFKKIIDSVCNHTNDPKIHKHIRYFFEFSLNRLTVISDGSSRYTADLELFEFIIYQLFLSYVAILQKNEEFAELKEITDELFVIPDYFHERNLINKHQNFCIFKIKKSNTIYNELMKNKISPLGCMLKTLSDEAIISFNQIIEADIFLYIKSILELSKGNPNNIWWPHTAFYLNYRQEALRVFLKSEKPSYFEEIKNTLGCENLLFIEKICPQEGDWSNYYVPKWRDNGLILNIRSLTNYEKLEPKKTSFLEIL